MVRVLMRVQLCTCCMLQPIYLRKHRLNIEEKKPKEELAAARLSSVRGGSVGRRGGYGRGTEVRNSVNDNETRTY